MCEPAHSIVQYPTDFDDHNLPGGQMDSESRLKLALGKFWNTGKRIKNWFHYSKLGAGHHSIFENGRKTLYLPKPTVHG